MCDHGLLINDQRGSICDMISGEEIRKIVKGTKMTPLFFYSLIEFHTFNFTTKCALYFDVHGFLKLSPKILPKFLQRTEG